MLIAVVNGIPSTSPAAQRLQPFRLGSRACKRTSLPLRLLHPKNPILRKRPSISRHPMLNDAPGGGTAPIEPMRYGKSAKTPPYKRRSLRLCF